MNLGHVAEAGPSAEHCESADGLYARVWPGLVRLAHLLTGSAAQGEDLAQEAFVGLLRNGPVTTPEAYLRRSVVNLAINSGKATRREQSYTARLVTQPVEAPAVDDLWPLLARLPARQRAVLVLRYYLDLSEAEIAQTLGCRPGTVKAHANKGLARLRRELA